MKISRILNNICLGDSISIKRITRSSLAQILLNEICQENPLEHKINCLTALSNCIETDLKTRDNIIEQAPNIFNILKLFVMR